MTAPITQRSSLAEVGSAALNQLRGAIARGRITTPITDIGALAELGLEAQARPLYVVLAGHSRLACLAILDVALEEREKYSDPRPELVWTGPEDRSATARDTSIVLRQLFEGAKARVILAGYSFDGGAELLAPLHRAMSERGVEAILFVHIEQPERALSSPSAYIDEALGEFVARSWSFGAPYPRIYYDKRALIPGGGGAPYVSLHAKCVIADDQRAFISSANFTERGHERNIEAGVENRTELTALLSSGLPSLMGPLPIERWLLSFRASA